MSWAKFEPGTCRMLFRRITAFFTSLPHSSCHLCSILLSLYNIHTSQTSMTLAGFDLANPASERPQAHALDRATIAIGNSQLASCFCSIQQSSDARSRSNCKFCLEYEFSLPCLQQSITGYCPEPTEYNPNPYTLIL